MESHTNVPNHQLDKSLKAKKYERTQDLHMDPNKLKKKTYYLKLLDFEEKHQLGLFFTLNLPQQRGIIQDSQDHVTGVTGQNMDLPTLDGSNL